MLLKFRLRATRLPMNQPLKQLMSQLGINQLPGVRIVVLLFVCIPRAANASCNQPLCMKRCQAECFPGVAQDAAAVCARSCAPVCSYETSCENQLGYRPTLHVGAHLSYGLGAAVVPGAVETGFRHHLELAAALGPAKDRLSLGNSVTGSNAPTTGLLFGASGLLGFGSSPSYGLVEAGYGSGSLAALGSLLAFGARLQSGVTPVVGLRGNADVLLLNVGVRTLMSFERKPDLFIGFTIGLGRY